MEFVELLIILCVIVLIVFGFGSYNLMVSILSNQKDSQDVCPVCGYYCIDKYRDCTPPIEKSTRKKKYDADVAGRIF